MAWVAFILALGYVLKDCQLHMEFVPEKADQNYHDYVEQR